jgi:putative salt-induced outer membrane protein YdiY
LYETTILHVVSRKPVEDIGVSLHESEMIRRTLMEKQCSGLKYIVCFMFFMLAVFIDVASGDEVVLENGDRLTGKIIKVEGGTLTLETGYSEPVKVQSSNIKKITTDGPVEMHLTSGEILKGIINTDANGNLIIKGTDMRETAVLGWHNVSAVNPPPVEPSRWKGSVNAGAVWQTGNSDRTNISFGANALRRTEQDRFNLRFLYNYAKEGEDVTTRSYYGTGKYDYFFTKTFYGYVGVELLKDKVKDLNLRTVVGPGVGYQFWDDEVKSLLLEAGVAYFSEDLNLGTDKDWITARLAADLRYNILKAVVFTDQLVMYPSLQNGRDYKLRNEAALTSPLASGWSLRLANILEHDGNPPDGIERNDWHWILGLLYSF